jgi:DnaK suppressor protein
MTSFTNPEQRQAHEVNPVTPADYPYFTDKLQARMGLLRSSVIEALSRSTSAQDVEVAGQVHDMKDDAFTERLAEVDQAEIAQQVAEIKDVEAAQRRIQQGEYGRCLACGAAIEWRRLDAYPTAKRCIACQVRCEQTPLASARPRR